MRLSRVAGSYTHRCGDVLAEPTDRDRRSEVEQRARWRADREPEAAVTVLLRQAPRPGHAEQSVRVTAVAARVGDHDDHRAVAGLDDAVKFGSGPPGDVGILARSEPGGVLCCAPAPLGSGHAVDPWVDTEQRPGPNSVHDLTLGPPCCEQLGTADDPGMGCSETVKGTEIHRLQPAAGHATHDPRVPTCGCRRSAARRDQT